MRVLKYGCVREKERVSECVRKKVFKGERYGVGVYITERETV